MVEDVFRDVVEEEPLDQVLEDTRNGSRSNSCRNEKAYPEYVVPKSIAATSKASFDILLVKMSEKAVSETMHVYETLSFFRIPKMMFYIIGRFLKCCSHLVLYTQVLVFF